MAKTKDADVIIVGAGPSGSFLACRLIAAGIKVLVLERDLEPESAVRAMAFYGAAQMGLRRADVFDEAKSRGFFVSEMSWRKPTTQTSPNERVWGDLIARWNPWEGSELTLGECGVGVLILGQDQLRDICKGRIEASPLGEIKVGHPVEQLEQDEEGVTVIAADAKTGERRSFTASFVVGSDGGRSSVRKLLGQKLEGHTWPQTVVGSDILVNLQPPKGEPVSAYVLNWTFSCFICPLSQVQEDGRTLYRFTVLMEPEDSHLPHKGWSISIETSLRTVVAQCDKKMYPESPAGEGFLESGQADSTFFVTFARIVSKHTSLQNMNLSVREESPFWRKGGMRVLEGVWQ